MDSSTGVLQCPVEGKPYCLFTDSSKFVVGSFLCQLQDDENSEHSEMKLYLLKFFSKNLDDRDLLLPIFVKELLSLQKSLKYFLCYLAGVTVHVFVDSKVVSYWVSMSICSERVARAISVIQEFDIKIFFVSSHLNVADVVTRMTGEVEKRVPASANVFTRLQIYNSEGKVIPHDHLFSEEKRQKMDEYFGGGKKGACKVV